MRELALHLLDVLQNSLAAGATEITLEISEDAAADLLTICVNDNGSGMSPEMIRRCVDPFWTTRTTRHVGLGLPLFAAAAERTGGALEIDSEQGQGVRLRATFVLSHPDRQPLGDVAATLSACLAAPTPPRLRYRHVVSSGEPRATGRSFEFDTDDLAAELEEVPLSNPAVQRWLIGYLTENESALGCCA
jgi:hypothetical protein